MQVNGQSIRGAAGVSPGAAFLLASVLATVFLFSFAAPATAASSAARVARKAMDAAGGGGPQGKDVEYPYKDKETPETTK